MQSAQEFVADKAVGIIVMVLSACCGLGGILLAAGMSLAGMGIAGAAAEGGGASAGQAAAAATFMGLGGAALGLFILCMAGVSFLCGFGIMKSARWGFILGTVWYGLSAVMDLVQLNVIGLLISGGLLAYCALRLTGNVGPKPT